MGIYKKSLPVYANDKLFSYEIRFQADFRLERAKQCAKKFRKSQPAYKLGAYKKNYV